MPSTVGTNLADYMTLAAASRPKAGARTDEALSNDEKAALNDLAHECRIQGVDALTFLVNAVRDPLNGGRYWSQAYIATPMTRTAISS